MARSNGKKNLGPGLLIWALVLICLIAAGLFALNAFLAAYEQAAPEKAAEAYLSALDDEKAFALAEESLRSFDGRLAPPEEIFALRVKPYLDAGLRAERDASACTQTREGYRLLSGEQPVGALVLEQSGKGRFGLPLWSVAEAGLDFSFLEGDGPRSITVPEGFTVLCNGRALDESYVTGRRESHGELDYLRDEGYALPSLVEYTVEGLPLTAEFRVLDEKGAELDPDTDFDALVTRRLLESCTPEERARLEAFVQRYAEAYVAFMGGTSVTYGAGYRQILPLLDEGSDLAQRLSSARKGMFWTHNRRNELQSVEIRALIALGGGVYVCDFCAPVNVQTLDGFRIAELNTRLFVVDRDGALRAFSVLSY